MLRHLRSLIRLVRAARVLGRHDALVPAPLRAELPALVIAALPLAKWRLPWEAPLEIVSEHEGERLAAALAELGPSYIKLGQFLATRPDLIGADLAADLTSLQDRLPPFPTEDARRIIEDGLEVPLATYFTDFSDAIAAASIAQVHRAKLLPDTDDAEGRDVAVKVLRPGVETRFAQDLDSFFLAARGVEIFYSPARRLRPVEIVQTLADSVKLEMDLRLEAAAMSEMAENIADDKGFRVPKVEWDLTAQRVLTLEWINGIPASDRDGLIDAGHDMARLGTQVIQSFLTHALRDGFFHADLHQGNLFVDADGTLVAVDFGIMGRIGANERRFLAEILYGFIMRDYVRVAEVHFEAGYVPRTKSTQAFAQALRSVGEPIFGRPASEVSMGRLLAQLFQVTEQFDMKTRPELILLQKTMVVVEGVARHFDPDHNIWESAEPVVKAWITARMGPEARLEEAAAGAMQIGRVMAHLPEMLDRAERAARLFAENVDEDGVRVHPDSKSRSATAHPAFWVVLGALAALILTKLF